MNGYRNKNRKNAVKKNPASKGYGMLALFLVVAAVIAILTTVLSSPDNGSGNHEKGHPAKIKEIRKDALVMQSESDALGSGDVIIAYDANIVVQDINGQIIDFAELHMNDRVEVLLHPESKDKDGKTKPPSARKMILLPDDSNDYV